MQLSTFGAQLYPKQLSTFVLRLYNRKTKRRIETDAQLSSDFYIGAQNRPLRLCLHRLGWGGLLFSLLRVDGGAIWRGCMCWRLALSLATSGKLARRTRCGGSAWLCGAFYWTGVILYHCARKALKTHCSASDGIGEKIARRALPRYGQRKAPAIFSPGRPLYSVQALLAHSMSTSTGSNIKASIITLSQPFAGPLPMRRHIRLGPAARLHIL